MNRIKAWLLLQGPALVGLAAALLIGGVALARAGGGGGGGGGGGEGGGSPSGGGGDHGGGGGGGGGGGLLSLLLWIFLDPAIPGTLKIGTIAAIAVGWAVMRRRRRRRDSEQADEEELAFEETSRPVEPEAPFPDVDMTVPPDEGELAVSIAEYRRRDPLFGLQAYEDMVSTAFIKIQEAWSRRDLGLARAFLTPALLIRFQAQIDELKKTGRTNHVEQAVIGAVDLVEISHDGGNDYITARVVAAAADYTTDRTGAIVAGSKQVRKFTEYWTFMRSDQVKTQQGKEPIASEHCPNCGAPLKLTAVGKCEYCSSDVTTGQFSWVLSEITQANAWRPRAEFRDSDEASPLAGERYVLGWVPCPKCGSNVKDINGIIRERCWKCGATVPTER